MRRFVSLAIVMTHPRRPTASFVPAGAALRPATAASAVPLSASPLDALPALASSSSHLAIAAATADDARVFEAVAPDGVVSIDDALWKARTNRATPVAEGDTIRVVAVEGLVLEIEPEAGGARDYRERRGSRRES